MGTIREQDFRIRSEVEIPTLPVEGTLFKIGFVFKSETITQVTEIKTKEDYDKVLGDSNEKVWAPWQNRSFFAIPFSSDTSIVDDIAKVGKECFILVLSLSATQAMADKTLDWWGILFHQNISAKPWEDKDTVALANTSRTGVFCDMEKEGKAFYALNKVLAQGYPTLSNIKSDITPFHSNFNTLEQRDALLETGFSWYKDTKQGVSIWDIFVGGFQFKAIMGLYIADDEAKSIYTDYINTGKPINASSIGEIEVSIGEKLGQLVKDGVIAHFKIHKTPTQSPANIVKGIVKLGNKECGLVSEYNLISYTIKGV